MLLKFLFLELVVSPEPTEISACALGWLSGGPHLSLSSRHLPKLVPPEGKPGFLNSGSLMRSEVEETFN